MVWQTARRLFQLMDRNGDGSLSRAEIIRTLVQGGVVQGGGGVDDPKTTAPALARHQPRTYHLVPMALMTTGAIRQASRENDVALLRDLKESLGLPTAVSQEGESHATFERVFQAREGRPCCHHRRCALVSP